MVILSGDNLDQTIARGMLELADNEGIGFNSELNILQYYFS